MIRNIISAPQFDVLIEYVKRNQSLTNKTYIQKFEKLFDSLKQVKEIGDDQARSFWFELKRGLIEDFGSFENYLDEGMVENEDDFKKLWKENYPTTSKWYKFGAATYNGEYYYYVDNNLLVHTQPEEAEIDLLPQIKDFYDKFLLIVSNQLSKIVKSPEKYNSRVSIHLPYNRRFGRILRNDYWDIFKNDKKNIAKNIKSETIEIIGKLAQSPNMLVEKYAYEKFTSGDFFRICALGYSANGYFSKVKKNLTDIEQYGIMADGRDCGLKMLDTSSFDAFEQWYRKDASCGGHPWEICRGGNSTHISLYVRFENGMWLLDLAGSSRSRVVETVLFAEALFKNKVPFTLRDAEAIYRMITGTDYIGIVPETVFPRYCHNLFPKEDKIIDFMQLGTERKGSLIKMANWYPEEPLVLKLS